MLRNLLKRWLKNEEASTAIEFSFLSGPYIFLTIAIIELSMMYASACMLEGATNSAARLIKTGQLQQAQSGDPEDLFVAAVCDYADVLIKCNEIGIDVRKMDSFTDFDEMKAEYDENGNLIKHFDMATSEERIMIRTAYRYKMMTPLVGPLLAGPGGAVLFVSTIVLQVEPYDFGGSA